MKQQLAEFWILVTDDKKKAGILGGLVGLLVIVGLKTMFAGSPEIASASQAVAGASGVDQALNHSGSSSMASNQGILDSRVVSIPEPEAVSRDLFEISDLYFPQPAQPEQTEPVGGKSVNGSADTSVGLPPEPVETPEERIAGEASALELRSTLVGENPVAILVFDGERSVMAPGDTVGGFVLREVRAQSVLLEKDGITVEVSRE